MLCIDRAIRKGRPACAHHSQILDRDEGQSPWLPIPIVERGAQSLTTQPNVDDAHLGPRLDQGCSWGPGILVETDSILLLVSINGY